MHLAYDELPEKDGRIKCSKWVLARHYILIGLRYHAVYSAGELLATSSTCS